MNSLNNVISCVCKKNRMYKEDLSCKNNLSKISAGINAYKIIIEK